MKSNYEPSRQSDYLLGKRFDAALKVPIRKDANKIRDQAIIERTKGKRVIDIGFADVGSFIRKYERGEWLHAKIQEHAEACIGIDIDRTAVEEIRTRFDGDIRVLDISVDGEALARDFLPQLIILADVLEHVANPGRFLSSVTEMARQSLNPTEILITVPNYLDLSNIYHCLKHEELVNSDHRFWFSPYTISKLIFDSGLRIKELHLVSSGAMPETLKGKMVSWLVRKYPLLNSTVLCIAEVSDPQSRNNV